MTRPPVHAPWRPNMLLLQLLAVSTLLLAACSGSETSAGDATEGGGSGSSPAASAPPADAESDALTVYSGRSEELVGPFLERFTEATGIEIDVRYGDTAEVAATILEEGDNSPADVYFGQDAGALGALDKEGVLAELPGDLTGLVDERFRSEDGTWVGVSGRARVLVYSTELVSEGELPDSVLDLTGPEWAGRVGWAPTNGSFQAFITAMRLTLGDEATQQWVEDMIANDVQVFENNSTQVTAAGAGEIAIGLVNHYYLFGALAEDPDLPAANHYLTGGDPGALVNVAGAGILATSDQPDESTELVRYMLSEEGQTYFAEETYEYALVDGVSNSADLPPLDEVQAPDVDLNDLDDLAGTLELLQAAGAL